MLEWLDIFKTEVKEPDGIQWTGYVWLRMGIGDRGWGTRVS